MKAIAMTLLLGVLAGCASEPKVSWDQGAQTEVADTTITLTANLWQNHMVGEGLDEDPQTLHGALYLHSIEGLPAGLDVRTVILKQPEQEWILQEEDFELRVDDEQHWEVAFLTRTGFETKTPVDVLLTVRYQGKTHHLVARQVMIDVVH